MDPRFSTTHLEEFNDAVRQVYLGASAIRAEDLEVLSRPFLWWNDLGITFDELEHQMRNVMARLLGLLSLHAPAPGKSVPVEIDDVAPAIGFLDAYINRHEIELLETSNPARTLRDACYSAKWLLDETPGPILARVPQMAQFHEGWRGILPDALIDLEDVAAFDMLENTCSELVDTEKHVYGLVRRHGASLLAPIEELVPTLLPADQVRWLRGLGAFPKHEGVIALYERVIATTDSEWVRETTATYLESVRSGVETEGFEH
jgi:hypothetical protein